MKQIVSDAIVLRRINYQEADRILTVLSSENGKIVLLAKGVRKPKSKMAGGIELFGTNQVTYIAGKGEINTLISARVKKHYGSIVGDLDRTQSAYEFIKLINKSIENDSGEEFYGLLESAFGYLDDIKVDLDIIRVWFGLRFLDLMGHSPNLDLDEEVKAGDASTKFRFDLDKMNFATDENGAYSPNHLKLFVLSLSSGPDQLRRVVGVTDLMPQLLNLVQNLMISSGFSKI